MTDRNRASEDYEKARDTLYELLEDAKEALELSKEILRESEHPRAVEVYSGLLANAAKISAQILQLSKTHKDITERKGYDDPGSGDSPAQLTKTTNNLFIGSTTELQQLISDARRDMIDITNDG